MPRVQERAHTHITPACEVLSMADLKFPFTWTNFLKRDYSGVKTYSRFSPRPLSNFTIENLNLILILPILKFRGIWGTIKCYVYGLRNTGKGSQGHSRVVGTPMYLSRKQNAFIKEMGVEER